MKPMVRLLAACSHLIFAGFLIGFFIDNSHLMSLTWYVPSLVATGIVTFSTLAWLPEGSW